MEGEDPVHNDDATAQCVGAVGDNDRQYA